MAILWRDNYGRLAKAGVVAVLLALSVAAVGRLHEISKPMCTYSSMPSYSPHGVCCLGVDVHALRSISMLADIRIC